MDLVIKGNFIVTPYSIGPAEIGIAGEKIVAIAAPGSPVSYTHLTLPTIYSV